MNSIAFGPRNLFLDFPWERRENLYFAAHAFLRPTRFIYSTSEAYFTYLAARSDTHPHQ